MCSWPHPYSTLILGVFPLHQIAHVGVSERMGLFGREIIFNVLFTLRSDYTWTTTRSTTTTSPVTKTTAAPRTSASTSLSSVISSSTGTYIGRTEQSLLGLLICDHYPQREIISVLSVGSTIFRGWQKLDELKRDVQIWLKSLCWKVIMEQRWYRSWYRRIFR